MASKKKVKKVSYAKIYNWVPGSRFASLDVNVIGAEIDRLATKYEQRLTAEHVVEEARSPKSPMHSVFRYDEDQAMAHEGRLYLARTLLRSVRVKIITPERKEVTVRMTVSTPRSEAPSKGQYSTTEYALNDPELRSEVLKQALRDLIVFRRKYAELSELAVVFDAIDKVRRAA